MIFDPGNSRRSIRRQQRKLAPAYPRKEGLQERSGALCRNHFDQARRQTWGELTPATLRPANSKAYNRKKSQDWNRELPPTQFCDFSFFTGYRNHATGKSKSASGYPSHQKDPHIRSHRKSFSPHRNSMTWRKRLSKTACHFILTSGLIFWESNTIYRVILCGKQGSGSFANN